MAQPSTQRLDEMYTELKSRAPADFGRHRAALAQNIADTPPGPERDRLIAELAVVNDVNSKPDPPGDKP